ncbi:SapC family protein [Nitrosomonas sp.]|uniref:SapC family protein n=1 Tax=Nitrosomonas sp. TaxID=42353 RepID=UPI002611ECCD|nr:SapC family protein [Nitrosomonas sp.]MCW5602368.1 SapC family protein [Nitrosomonas sp.]
MTENAIQPLSKSRHALQRWRPYRHYDFAANDAVVPIVAAELYKAVMALPIGFVAVESGFVMVAVQGLAAGKNLLVAKDGSWLASYIPAAYRGYPFLLANTSDGKQVLCINEGSGVITDDPDGERFFDDEGNPAKSVLDVLEFLKRVATAREATKRICAALQKYDLIQPWTIKIQHSANEQQIAGLYRVDEAVLNTLTGDALVELRDIGALQAAYCQLLSMQHLPRLGDLAQAHAKAGIPSTPSGELDLEFLNQGGTLKFDHLN